MSGTRLTSDAPSHARRTLFWKYAAYFSGLVGALLIVSGGLGGYFAYRQSTDTLENLQRTKAQFAGREIASFMGRVEEALQATTTKFDTADANEGANLRLELIGLLRHQPSITEVYWIAPDGGEVLALSRVVRDVAESGRIWTNDPRFVDARAHGKHIGPVHFRGGTEPYVSLAVSRNLRGPVLVAEVNLKFVGDVISNLHDASTSVVYVVDRDARLIAHPDSSLVLGNTDLSSLPQVRRVFGRSRLDPGFTDRGRNVDGVAVLATAVPIEYPGWTVFAEQAQDEALRPVYVSIARSVALVLLGLIAAIGTSLVLARRMMRPIRQIEAGAREIGAGRLDRRIVVPTGDELEALADQFNRMAAKLHETYATLETRIEERTRDLALANETKTRFLAVASHDLRQPIHALALFVGQLRGIPVPPEGRALVDRIERSVDSLEALLEALLDLSTLDVGAVTPHLQDFAVQDLLSRLVADFAPAAEAKGLALTLVPTSLWIRSDPILLERILLNLVANAIRYTAEGRVLIGCRRRAEQVDLIIADSGIGIAPVHLPNIFHEFYRVGPRHGGTTEGLGLGLTIVRRLTLLLGHPITVESLPGKGTFVRLGVPRAMARERGIAPQAVIAPDLCGTRVLVVDDEAPARDALQGMLAQWGCEVVTAEGGDDAIEFTRNWLPDLVLCDLSLAGGESGLQVVDRLRRERGSKLPCAFITGESAPERIFEARESGIPIAFKPTKPGKLRALIEHLLYTRSVTAG